LDELGEACTLRTAMGPVFWILLMTPAGALGHGEGSTEIEVRWQAPAECPSDAAFVEHLRDTVANTLERGSGDVLSVEALVTTHGQDDWNAHMELQYAGSDEVLEIAAPTCDDLLEVSVLAAATFVLTAVERREEAEGEPASEESPGAMPPPEAAKGRRDGTSRRASRLRAKLWVHGGPAFGLGPGWSGLVGGGVGLGAGAFEVELGGHFRFATDSAPNDADYYFRSSMAFASTVALWAPTRGRVGFRLGGGVGLGAALAEGRGDLDPALRDSAFWAAGLIQAGVVGNVTRRFAVRVMVFGSAGMSPSFVVQTPGGEETLRAAPTLGGFLTLGIHFSIR